MQPQMTFGFNYIEEFNCLADSCEDNCCSGDWRIAIDDEQVETYRTHYPNIFNIIAKDNGGYIMSRKDSTCAGNEAGLCSIHRDHGESVLSNTCINYPRLYRSIGEHFTKGGTMSCPEITRKCLFDEHPFDLIESKLPDNHSGGRAIPKSYAQPVTDANWKSVVSHLLNLVLNEKCSIENTLYSLQSVIPKLESTSTDAWPEILFECDIPSGTIQNHEIQDSGCQNINQSKNDIQYPSEDSIRHYEKVTMLLGTLLEHLDRPSASDLPRQQAVQSFEVISQPSEPTRVKILPLFKQYHNELDAVWIQTTLKRFVAAEITRCGFPFISETSIGKDYGDSLTEWFHTLCVRTLALRLHLVIQAAHTVTQEELTPKKEWIVDWVYQYCRKINHERSGSMERALRNVVNEEGLDDLWLFSQM
ncbi:flagellin lysine-N-methylase [Marinomonas balearica]|uniref:Lysine-N-methylase n=1 Tax=Marinomonas balearica TaxID=491947 RepID=A0A4R6M425_9GAMM|nr:flagellin lysine-N-methylase [Marinomonas balearica]TDO95766.1 lysine-N-methylase [Marinomonas balearica]